MSSCSNSQSSFPRGFVPDAAEHRDYSQMVAATSTNSGGLQVIAEVGASMFALTEPIVSYSFNDSGGDENVTPVNSYITPACKADPTTPNCLARDIAILNGPPKQGDKCTSTSGSDSLPVGGTVGSVTNGNGQQFRSVADINDVYSSSWGLITSPSSISNQLYPVGWVYKDNAGDYWFQKDPSTVWTYSIGAGMNAGSLFSTSFGVSPPTTNVPIPLPKAPKPSESELGAPCFSQGQTFG